MTKPPEQKLVMQIYQRDYYLQRTAHKNRCVCANCSKKLRTDSAHAPLCRACWDKTDEGKEYFKRKKAKSRENAPAPDQSLLGKKPAMTGAERSKKYYLENKEKCRERSKEKSKKYYLKNKEKCREYFREYYLKNKEKYKKLFKKWHAKHKKAKE
jgi:hypothetical protein